MKNPWIVDASDGATGKTFEIRTLFDFFQVPEDRRRICLREFHSWLAIQEGFTALVTAVGDVLDTPVPASALHWENEVFRWTDDGKGCIGIQMKEFVAAQSSEQPTPTNALDPPAQP